MQLKIDELVQHLKNLKQTQGSEAYQLSLESLARNIMHNDAGVTFVQQIAEQLGEENLDMDRLKAESEAQKKSRDEVKEAAGGPNTQKAFLSALQQQMPNLRTQAHFDLVTSAFEALQLSLNAYFGGDTQGAAHGRDALNQVLDLAAQVKGIDDKLKENPEAVTNPDFVEPPREYQEPSLAEDLMSELAEIDSAERLQSWYSENREALDGVTDRQARNQLFDSIRQKRKELAN